MLSIFTIIVTENIKGFFIVTYVISLFSESIVDLSPLDPLTKVWSISVFFTEFFYCFKMIY